MPVMNRPAGRPRACSVPIFCKSSAHGRTYIDRTNNKQEYEYNAHSVFDSEILAEVKKLQKLKKAGAFMFEKACDDVFETVNCKDPQPSGNLVSSMGSCTYVTSYSMKDTNGGELPAIYVPGQPRLYKQPFADEFPLKVLHDAGSSYMDEHAGRFPDFQYLPMLLAILAGNPNFRFDEAEVDIVVNRSTLEALMRFIKGCSAQAFHLELVMVGKTLFIGRKSHHAKSRSQEDTCGRNFEEFLTMEDLELEDATSHHRYIMYHLGHLKIIVRFEVDARMDESEVPEDPTSAPCHYPEPSATGTHTASLQHPDCTVILKGTITKQEVLVEMKSGKRETPKEQMWYGRTTNCILAKGRRKSDDGHTIYSIKEFETKHLTQSGAQRSFEDIEASMRGQDGQDKDYFEKLVWLLQKILDTVDKTKDRSAILVSLGDKTNKDKDMRIYETKKRLELAPKELVEQFWSKKE